MVVEVLMKVLLKTSRDRRSNHHLKTILRAIMMKILSTVEEVEETEMIRTYLLILKMNH
jgi:hypothetical protein